MKKKNINQEFSSLLGLLSQNLSSTERKEKIAKAKQIGELVRIQRKKKNLTQEELAGVSNTGTRFISDLENGKETCELQKVLEVLNMLGIKINLEPDN